MLGGVTAVALTCQGQGSGFIPGFSKLQAGLKCFDFAPAHLYALVEIVGSKGVGNTHINNYITLRVQELDRNNRELTELMVDAIEHEQRPGGRLYQPPA